VAAWLLRTYEACWGSITVEVHDVIASDHGPRRAPGQEPSRRHRAGLPHHGRQGHRGMDLSQ
jgi:hypothetical protein